jgi:hypothetical protein
MWNFAQTQMISNVETERSTTRWLAKSQWTASADGAGIMVDSLSVHR